MPLTWRSWLVGFGLTLALELPIVLLALRRRESSWARRMQAALFANLLTHPLVWFCFPTLPVALSTRLAASELWAFGAEAWFYASYVSRLGPARACVTSLVANATSFVVGWILVARLGHWLF